MNKSKAPKKTKHGGAREGAGRKPEGRPPKRPLGTKVSKEAIVYLKSLSAITGQSQASILEWGIQKITQEMVNENRLEIEQAGVTNQSSVTNGVGRPMKGHEPKRQFGPKVSAVTKDHLRMLSIKTQLTQAGILEWGVRRIKPKKIPKVKKPESSKA